MLKVGKSSYIGIYDNNVLNKFPSCKVGDLIFCTECGRQHPLEKGISNDGSDSTIMFYKCKTKTYIGAVNNRCVAFKRPDIFNHI
jgi:hypothetical protein